MLRSYHFGLLVLSHIVQWLSKLLKYKPLFFSIENFPCALEGITPPVGQTERVYSAHVARNSIVTNTFMVYC